MNQPTVDELLRIERRTLVWLLVCAAFEAVLVIAHVQYGAARYENPGLQHVTLVALCWLALALVTFWGYVRRPSNTKRWWLSAFVGLPFVGVFGLVHGGVGHCLKLVLYVAGIAPNRLAAVVDVGDFVVPDDVFFESTGIGTLIVALVVGAILFRFLRISQVSQVKIVPIQ